MTAVSPRPVLSRSAKAPGALRRPGWPKTLPCPRCGRLRVASWAGDRMHLTCSREAE